jgi:hypothetical protein
MANSRCSASPSQSAPCRAFCASSAARLTKHGDLPAQPYRPNGIDRFLYRADDHNEGTVRIYCSGTRSSQAVTEHPTGAWTAQQIVEAFADREAAHYLIRDRDSRYSAEVRLRIKSLGMQEILTAPQSPWQNPYAERLIGSIRRECLNHHIILNARHLNRTLSSYFRYYQECQRRCKNTQNAV